MAARFIIELKSFIMRKNIIDTAVGVVVGIAFAKVIDSLVADIIMPPISLLIGKTNSLNLYYQLAPRDIHYDSLELAKAAGATTINYGVFLNNFITFLIIATSVFMVIKIVNKLKAKICQKSELIEEITTKICPYCISEIPVKATKCPHCTSRL